MESILESNFTPLVGDSIQAKSIGTINFQSEEGIVNQKKGRLNDGEHIAISDFM
jgi:hypothetical protein